MLIAMVLDFRVKGLLPSIISIEGPSSLFLSILSSSHGQLLEKDHAAIMTKMVVGKPGTMVPSVPKPTQTIPNPANAHLFKSFGFQLSGWFNSAAGHAETEDELSLVAFPPLPSKGHPDLLLLLVLVLFKILNLFLPFSNKNIDISGSFRIISAR